MKNIIVSSVLLLTVVGLVVFGIQVRSESWSVIVFVSAIGVFGAAVYFGYLENLRALIWLPICGWGAFWSGAKTIQSIDFTKPFLLSFYWSTMGYFFLTLVLLLLTIGAVVIASENPDKVT